MKKFLLFGICGILLVACDSNSEPTGMEEWCLNNVVAAGMKIDTTITKHCKCIQEKMIKKHGVEYTKTFVEYDNEVTENGVASATKKYPDFPVYESKDKFGTVFEECSKISGYGMY